VTGVFGQVRARERALLAGWARGGLDARAALRHAAGILRDGGAETAAAGDRGLECPEASRISDAAVQLRAGRDLLCTHHLTRQYGARRELSDWAPVITSPPVSRALLSEVAVAARRIAAIGRDVTSSPAGRRQPRADRQLDSACDWLAAADSAIQAGLGEEPVTAADRLLLHAVPVNASPQRRVPDGTEPVPVLCDGVVSTAQRLRHAARPLPDQAAWSPALTITGLREVALTSTVTSRNCELVLRALAARTARIGPGNSTAGLLESADAASRACAQWLRVARELKRLTTDTRGRLSAVAAEAGDLALWTGRLAYADPKWVLASGPSRPARRPENLAASADEVPAVVGAVHQACETLARPARAEQDQVRTAAAAGRLLVPVSSLPEQDDVPHPFVPAPQGRVQALLALYGEAGQASRDAVAGLDKVAVAVRAPSQVLSRARAAIETTRSGIPRQAPAGPLMPGSSGAGSASEPGGPVERQLRHLGVTREDLLRRAADLDSASSELIMTAAEEVPAHPADAAAELSRGSAELASHAAASGASRGRASRRPGVPAPAGQRTRARQAEP
jgi:hypothetical protein